MAKVSESSRELDYLNSINGKSNRILARLFGFSVIAGIMTLLLAAAFGEGKNLQDMLPLCFAFIIITLISSVIAKSKLPANVITHILSSLIVIMYLALNFAFARDGGLTVWAAIFILMCASLVFINNTALVYSGAAGIAVCLYFIVTKPNVTVVVDMGDHVGRLGAVLIVFGLALYANFIYRRRLRQNIRQIIEITDQKEEITLLYKEITASQEELLEKYNALSKAEEKAYKLAYYDELTGLPKRHKLLERLEGSINRCKNENNGSVGLIFIDIDNFKYINDFFGYDAGDEFAKHISKRIFRILDNDRMMLSKLDSDEFAVLVDHCGDRDDLEETVKQIMAVFEDNITSKDLTIHLTISAGLALYPEHGGDADELLKNVDIAMNYAKTSGKNCYRFFNCDIRNTLNRKIELKTALRKVIENDELSIYYQPIFEIETGKISGFEALLRWHSKKYGYVSPSEFIPLAEESGLIISIGKWVLENVCEKCREVNEPLREKLTFAVNVSAVQLKNRGFLEQAARIFGDTGVDRSCIEMEITESVVIDSFDDTLIVLNNLKGMGLRLSMDDFGTGYSSLAYLQRLPIDKLKIDRAFVNALNSDNGERNLVESIVAMAHKMKLEVVAEGVETDEQLVFVKKCGCNLVQGFYFSEPGPWDEIEKKVS